MDGTRGSAAQERHSARAEVRTGNRVLDPRDLVEVLRVGQAERAHAERVARLLEVALKHLAAHVDKVGADLALVLDAESVELVQPERDWLAVPPEREPQRGLVLAISAENKVDV